MFLRSLPSIFPIKAPVFTPVKPSFSESAKSYFGSLEGSQNTIETCARLFEMVKLTCFFKGSTQRLLVRCQVEGDLASGFLNIPRLAVDYSTFYEKNLLAFSIPSIEVVKEVVFDVLGLFTANGKVALLASELKWIPLTLRQVSGLNAAVSAAYLVGDSRDLARDVEVFQQAKKNSYEARLAFINVGKNLASVVGSALSLVAYLFGIVMYSHVLAVSICLLGLTTCSTKIAAFFYERMVVGSFS